jgi:hypothetical protein
MSAPAYIKNLLRPNGQKPSGRKVWSIDLESVWLPFFTATNTEGITLIPSESLGAPLRLAYELDGSVKFNSKTGKPVIKVVKDVSDQIRLVRENFVAGLQQYVTSVQSKEGEAYKEQVRLNIEAGTPIRERDREALDNAIAEMVERAMAEREAEPAQTEAVKEAVTA